MKRAVLAIALGVAAWSPASAQDAPSGLTPVYAPAPRSSSAPSGNVARPSASAQDDGAAREDASAQEGASARDGASAQHGGDAPSSPTPPPVSPSGSRATLVPEPASVEIGEPVEWMLDVVHSKKLRVGFPAKDAEDRRFAPLSERTVARAADPNDDALVHTIARWTTMALEPGDLAPPPLALELTGGAATETLVVNGLPVHVAGALAEGEDAPRPLLGLRELSPERAAELEPARRAPLVLAGLGALLVVALGWLLGPFAGGLVATRIAEHNRPLHAYAIAGILFAATLSNLMRIPHPFWMTFAAVFGIPFAGWLAVRFAPTDGPAA